MPGRNQDSLPQVVATQPPKCARDRRVPGTQCAHPRRANHGAEDPAGQLGSVRVQRLQRTMELCHGLGWKGPQKLSNSSPYHGLRGAMGRLPPSHEPRAALQFGAGIGGHRGLKGGARAGAWHPRGIDLRESFSSWSRSSSPMVSQSREGIFLDRELSPPHLFISVNPINHVLCLDSL